LRELSGESTGESDSNEDVVDARARSVAARLVAAGHAERALAQLIERTRSAGTCAPREVTRLEPNAGRPKGGPAVARPGRNREIRGVRPHDGPRNGRAHDLPHNGPRNGRAQDLSHDGPRNGRPNDGPRNGRPNDGPRNGRPSDGPRNGRPNDDAWGLRAPAPRPDADASGEGWIQFRVSWGEAQGADARRLLPMLCRRGKIRGSDIGAIQLAPSFSLVQVATGVAADFERATRRPDPRDPGVFVRRETNDFERPDRGRPGRHRPS
jgi:ATP-dependent RNA helicase DeaD